jgi:hypothetical protein
MSKDVAVISADGEVVNISVQGDDYALFPFEVLVTHKAWIGGHYFDGNFYPPQPYLSWSWVEGEGWQPPAPMPETEGMWVWDEDAGEWVDVTP